MFRYARLTVAAYEAVAGAIALLLLGDQAIRGCWSVGYWAIAGLGALSLISGVLIGLSRPRWLWLAMALQLAQALYLVTPWIQYGMVIGVRAGAAFVFQQGRRSAVGITFGAHPMISFQWSLGIPTDTIVIGVNLVSVGMFLAVYREALQRYRGRALRRTGPSEPPV
jgi:hypothetical protein